MTILLQAVSAKHETRLRLVFSTPLAAGAFGVPAPAYYAVTCEDGRGPNPPVKGAYIVPGCPAVVELALGQPLVRSSLYTITAEGVPAADLTVTAAGTELSLRWGLSAPKENVEPGVRDRRRLLYGVDLVWNGTDYQESATGDLDRVEGTANVTKALNRAVEANGLPWDPAYGARIREFVDSPSTASGSMKGAVASQILRDPRVASLKVSYEIDDSNTHLYVDPLLVSGETVERVSITVPNE